MTQVDLISVALCAWKENRGGGSEGMQSVINIILNRAKSPKFPNTPYAVVYEYLQFSSMTYHRDPEYLIQAAETDPSWITALNLAKQGSNLPDITQGATFYYALSLGKAPDWAAKMTPTVVICGQQFFRD